MQELHLHTGCRIEPPDERDFDYSLIENVGGEIPDEFIIDVPWHFYQNGIPSCVGSAVAGAKSVQEKKQLSPRFIWGLTKRFDDNYLGWGANISDTLKQTIKYGIADYGQIDEKVIGVEADEYMRFDLTDELKENAYQNRAESYWRITRWNREEDTTAIKQALLEGTPLITSMYWFESYNRPENGFLPQPSGKSYGHAFILIGWGVDQDGYTYFIFKNSWQPNWGDKGNFYIYEDQLVEYGVKSMYVIKDIPQDRARILNLYDGKLVKNREGEHKERIIFVKDGEMFWIKDDASWKLTRKMGLHNARFIDIDIPLKEEYYHTMTIT